MAGLEGDIEFAEAALLEALVMHGLSLHKDSREAGTGGIAYSRGLAPEDQGVSSYRTCGLRH